MRKLFYQIYRALANIFGRPISLIASFLSLLLLFFMLTVIRTAYLSGMNYFQSQVMDITMEVYLDDQASDIQSENFVRYAQSLLGVDSVIYISKEDARQRLLEMMGLDLLDGLEENPLPRSVLIEFNRSFVSKDFVEGIIEQIMKQPAISEVYYPSSWLEKSENSKQLLLKAVIFLSAAVGLAIIFNLLHIIRLSARYYQIEIKQMRLLGAGKLYLSIPYIIEGLFYGLAASGFAWGILLYFINNFSFDNFQILVPPTSEILYFCAGASLIGMLVGLITVRRSL